MTFVCQCFVRAIAVRYLLFRSTVLALRILDWCGRFQASSSIFPIKKAKANYLAVKPTHSPSDYSALSVLWANRRLETRRS